MIWIGPAIPRFRDCNATYCEAPLQNLPAVQASENLAWLEPLYPSIDAEMKKFRPGVRERQRYSQKAKAILAQAAELGLCLPTTFKDLIQSETLQDRIPSVTACYFDLPEKIVRALFGLDGHLIRFMNDQQVCVLWYLFLPLQGEPFVVASYPVQGADFLEELNIEDAHAVAEATDATRIVAGSFTEFLYRYWIENTIWFKRRYKINLSPNEAAYIGSA